MQTTPIVGALEVMTEVQMTCAAAFVEGGVQDACDDACSICLENFSENDPATITVCKHEYHLQCILEWSQRSRECPMCWQPLCLKDPDSQSLLNASEQERVLQHHRSSPFYQHPALDDTEFHRFGPPFGDDSDLEDRIMHHLAAAAMGRAQQFTRRGESLRFRPSPGHIFLQSSMPTPSVDSSGVSSASATSGDSTSGDLMSGHGGRNMDSGSTEAYSLRQRVLVEHVEERQQGTSSSDLSLSETFKSRLVAASSRYRESLTKTTRGFRERLRVRNGTISELGTRAREVSAGVVRALERISLESPEKQRDSSSAPNSSTSIDLRIGTMLVQSVPSHVSEWTKETQSSGSLGEAVYPGSETASSSTNAQQNGVATNPSLVSTPTKEQSNEEGSSCSHDHQQPPVSPLAP